MRPKMVLFDAEKFTGKFRRVFCIAGRGMFVVECTQHDECSADSFTSFA